MSGIFGIFRRDGAQAEAKDLDALRDGMRHWGRDASRTWLQGPAGLGQLVTFDTPESRFECFPRQDPETSLVFTAAARIDNRAELCRALDLPSGILSGSADSELLLHAYRLWGENCCERILGDWSFAVWHPQERRLFLARDHMGITALHYHVDARIIAFASDPNALLAASLVPIALDEYYVAQILVCSLDGLGERTVHRPIRPLPPAHCLTVDDERVTTRNYWLPGEIPIRKLGNRLEYAEAARDLFDEAVRARLRSVGSVGVTLSGGLDSGSVAVTAAPMLASRGERLRAYSSVPQFDPAPYEGKGFGHEGSFARDSAASVGSIDHHLLDFANASPIQGCREMLRAHNGPMLCAGGFFWWNGIQRVARQQGCDVLLVGAAGNAGLSFEGHARHLGFWNQLRLEGLAAGCRDWLKGAIPRSWLSAWKRSRTAPFISWCRSWCINPAFARRIQLFDLCLENEFAAPEAFSREGRLGRLHWRFLSGGATLALDSAFSGLSIRDPLADARLLEFVCSVPEEGFVDPETGMKRWIIRDAMRGRLPDSVRLNRRRGRQTADIVPRLRQCTEEFDAVLCELEGGPAAHYVDVKQMNLLWNSLRYPKPNEPYMNSGVVLMRAILAGLYVNQYFARHPMPGQAGHSRIESEA